MTDAIWKLAQSVGFDDYELKPMLEAFASALTQATASEPFGQVTVVRREGCQPTYWFYPWGQLPYLDNAHECHTVYTAQPAPAARPMPDGERSAFEAWIAKDGGDLSTFGTGENTHYHNSAVNNAWSGWQARACIGSQPTAPAVPAEHDPGKWCEYVAGMLWCWLQMQNKALTDSDEDRYIKAITGIILRRLKWLKREPAPAAAVPEGWKLVPVKITEAMKDVGIQFEFATVSDGRLLAQTMWNELLASTPTSTAIRQELPCSSCGSDCLSFPGCQQTGDASDGCGESPDGSDE